MLKRFFKNVLWSAIPISLGVILMSFAWTGIEQIAKGEFKPLEKDSLLAKLTNIDLEIPKKEKDDSVFSFENIVYPPQAEYFIKDLKEKLEVGATAYIVGDIDTGEIILEKNSNSVLPIASVTKLMTALVSFEIYDQNQKTKVSNRAANTPSQRGDLRTGDSVLISDLLYPLLLVSSNNAAEVLAEHGGRENFMNKMNELAKEIGMDKTHFADPSGLSANNTSTTKDLFILSSHLMKNHKKIFDITKLEEYTAIGKIWRNINILSSNDNYLGGKTGYTERAKRTGVGIFSVSFDDFQNRNIAIILLRTDDRTKDIYTILNYSRKNVAYGYKEEIYKKIEGEVAGVNTSNIIEEKNNEAIKTENNNCSKPREIFPDLWMFNANTVNGLPEKYIPENLVPLKNKINTNGRDVCATKETSDALESMANGMREANLNLIITSAFRDYDTQKWLYDNWRKKQTVVIGEEAIAKPGHSEHQLGTTVDLTSPSVGLDSAHRNFHLTREYEWLDKNAFKYGFVMSYPNNKKTGYIFEPWHWRYVGIENAYHMKLADITIQEFLTGKDDNAKIIKKPKELTISFLGDIMMDRGVKASVQKNYDGDYNALFKNLGELKESDIVFANLEGPVSDVGNNVGSKYSFRMEPKSLDALASAGFNVLSFANNHVGDWNVAAFNDTLARLDKLGIVTVGAGKNLADASEVKIFEKNGIRVGFLGFTDVGPNWMKAEENKSGILLASDQNRLEYIKKAKESSDVLIVSYHWGDEYVKYNARQKSLAESSIDAGADIIVGHHPHVIQDTVIYKNGLIMYSLGNAIFDQYFSEETMKGALVNVILAKDGIKEYEEKVFILDKTYVPQTPTLK